MLCCSLTAGARLRHYSRLWLCRSQQSFRQRSIRSKICPHTCLGAFPKHLGLQDRTYPMSFDDLCSTGIVRHVRTPEPRNLTTTSESLQHSMPRSSSENVLARLCAGRKPQGVQAASMSQARSLARSATSALMDRNMDHVVRRSARRPLQ